MIQKHNVIFDLADNPDTIYIALSAKCSNLTLITPFTLQLFASTDNCLVGDVMTISMPNSH